MAHENLKQYLVGKPGKDFVTNLTLAVYDFTAKIRSAYGSYDFIHYRIFEEVTVREYTGEKNRWGDDKPEHYRFDCVFFVNPHRAALNQRQIYSVGVELKNSKGDLMSDIKIEHYLGYTDFFFIGAPSSLVEDAVRYAKSDEQIGVFDVENGKICKMPERIRPTVERQKNLLEQILFNHMFNKDFQNVVSVKVADAEVIHFIMHDDQPNSEPYSKGDAREKEQARREKHDAKVAVLQKEVGMMNQEVPSVISSILEGMSLNDQRVYHAIRRNVGVQAHHVAEILPNQEGVERPSLATIKRSISALTKVGLVEREGGRKTGHYIVKTVDCSPNNCMVCAKSPLCTQFRHVSESQQD